jgi:hypothetical protein
MHVPGGAHDTIPVPAEVACPGRSSSLPGGRSLMQSCSAMQGEAQASRRQVAAVGVAAVLASFSAAAPAQAFLGFGDEKADLEAYTKATVSALHAGDAHACARGGRGVQLGALPWARGRACPLLWGRGVPCYNPPALPSITGRDPGAGERSADHGQG